MTQNIDLQTRQDGDIRVMSYNLHHHRAFSEVRSILQLHAPDILCLQECKHDGLPDQIKSMNGMYQLADKTLSGRLDVAIYYHADRFEIVSTHTRQLGRSLIENVLRYGQDRLIISKMHDRATSRDIIVGSIHAAPLNASNRLRRLQVREACLAMHELSKYDEACVLIGDFNYPVFKNSLSRLANDLDFSIWRPLDHTYERGVVRGNFDFLLTKNIDVDSVDVLHALQSDHKPISARIRLAPLASFLPA